MRDDTIVNTPIIIVDKKPPEERLPETVEQSVTVKGPTILRQLINLGKRGEVGSEGYWDETFIPLEKIDHVSRKQKQHEKSILAERQSGDWNKLLDSGRTKKVKGNTSDSTNSIYYRHDTNASGNKTNPFQSFLESKKNKKYGNGD